jgi:hypothetical protein
MEWMVTQNKFLPLMVIRRYLKLSYDYCFNNELLDKKVEELNNLELPFNIDLIPTNYPNPNELILNMGKSPTK